MTYFFTADQHFGHANVIKFCSRPYSCVEEMNECLINNHNKVVSPNDVVVHGGDFTLIKKKSRIYRNYVNRLNGKHVFLEGSHDYWLKGEKDICNKSFDK